MILSLSISSSSAGRRYSAGSTFGGLRNILLVLLLKSTSEAASAEQLGVGTVSIFFFWTRHVAVRFQTFSSVVVLL